MLRWWKAESALLCRKTTHKQAQAQELPKSSAVKCVIICRRALLPGKGVHFVEFAAHRRIMGLRQTREIAKKSISMTGLSGDGRGWIDLHLFMNENALHDATRT